MAQHEQADAPDLITRAIDAAKDQVQVLKLETGDVLVARLGIENMGDGFPPWIPGRPELEALYDDLALVVPEGVKILVYHCGLDLKVVRGVADASEVRVEAIDG